MVLAAAWRKLCRRLLAARMQHGCMAAWLIKSSLQHGAHTTMCVLGVQETLHAGTPQLTAAQHKRIYCMVLASHV
jgi:hypothetical protein